MKSRLYFTTDENGFILVHVLFVISLSFILIASSIAAYRNDIYITERQIEQIKIETLFQMGQAKYKQDINHASSPILSTIYEFPSGLTDITVIEITDTHINLHFIIKFHDSDSYFPINHSIAYELD